DNLAVDGAGGIADCLHPALRMIGGARIPRDREGIGRDVGVGGRAAAVAVGEPAELVGQRPNRSLVGANLVVHRTGWTPFTRSVRTGRCRPIVYGHAVPLAPAPRAST